MPEACPTPLYPQLRPRRKGPSRERIAAHQRARLTGAMVEAVASHGYAKTTVDAVVALAGVSTKTLYQRFGNKDACFLATLDHISEELTARVTRACAGSSCAADAVHGAVGALALHVATQPKAARVLLLEASAAGPEAAGRPRQAQRLFEGVLDRCLRAAPQPRTLPPTLIGALVSGLWHVARLSLLDERPEQLLAHSRELAEWVLCHLSPTVRLLGHAPPAKPIGLRRLRSAEQGQSGERRIRMLAAAGRLAAADGHAQLTSSRIARLAGVSEETFFAEFADVDECLVGAFELFCARALVQARRASQCAGGRWEGAVRQGMGALLGHMAAEPVLARVACVEILATGRPGLVRLTRMIHSGAELLAGNPGRDGQGPGGRCPQRAPGRHDYEPIVAEAVAGAVWGLLQRHLANGSARSLPPLAGHATYLALAPVVGAQAAADEALGESDLTPLPAKERVPIIAGERATAAVGGGT